MPGAHELDAADPAAQDDAALDPAESRRAARRRGLRRGLLIGLVLVAVITAIQVVATSGDDGRGGEVVTVDDEGTPGTLGTADDRRGAMLADRSYERLDGTELRIAELRGKPVVLNFWATFCPPCIKEMPAFESVHQSVGDQVTFVGVNAGDRPDDAAEFVDETGVTYEIVLDPRGDLLAEVGGIVLPTTVLVDAEGRIIDSHNGELDAGELHDLLREHDLVRSA